MQTSLYEITFKDGRIYRVFCGNRKQNDDMIRFLTSPKALAEVKRKGVVIIRNGIHTMLEFNKMVKSNNL